MRPSSRTGRLLYAAGMAAEEQYVPPEEVLAATCAVCPAQLLRSGAFDVAPRPGPESSYRPELGWRADVATGVPTCVHPYRVGLPPGRYASAAEPLPPEPAVQVPDPAALVLPEDPTLLEAWLVAVLRTAPPERMAYALFQAEASAGARFEPRVVVAAMRRVMSHELARGR
ncbi:hypothetical protein Cs7R123_65810 [Catellatospora sp. TT07R-123]|uniref:hypothetical protein n=1 Tax=Catellatospora sp. TT07R-123 TaxID=2733863 RepID=UPI001B1922A1|nr:hypothetical protein [Catellatospora sp. TT07R-123]GHJ49239.1 hypothetical protein Cs7R123_65810 [Catellatospora sp. TT07R-123]